MIVWVPSWHSKRICTLHSPLLPSFLGLQVILPEIAEYDVMVQIKACGLSRIDTRVSWYTALHWQRRRKDSLIGGPQFLILLICSTGHIEWTWHRLKTLGAPPASPPPGSYTYVHVYTVCMCLYLQILSELNPISDQIPVGYEITGVVTKGNIRCQCMGSACVHTQLYNYHFSSHAHTLCC